jgi:hypothetical protein
MQGSPELKPYCKQAHGATYAQGKSKMTTEIISRPETKYNAHKEIAETTENSTTLFRKKNEELLKQYITVHFTLVVSGSYLGLICL